VQRFLVLITGVFLLFAACDQADDLAEVTSVGLRGEVIRAAALDGTDESDDSEVAPGVMQLREVEQTGDGDADALDECADAGDDESFTVFWTEETEFDPASVAQDAAFPQSLAGKTVSVDAAKPGVDFAEEDEDADQADEETEAPEEDEEGECVLIAERVSVRDVEETATPTPATGGAVRTPTQTPSPSPSPTFTPTPTVSPASSPTETVGLPEETP
jgi:hypothetical protein